MQELVVQVVQVEMGLTTINTLGLVVVVLVDIQVQVERRVVQVEAPPMGLLRELVEQQAGGLHIRQLVVGEEAEVEALGF